jgi:hypothetical protein
MATKIEYIRECKEVWRKIKASGLSKDEWLETEDGKMFLVSEYENDCPLCEGFLNYSKNDKFSSSTSCRKCPLVEQYDGNCYDLGYNDDGNYPDKWFEAIEGLEEKYHVKLRGR